MNKTKKIHIGKNERKKGVPAQEEEDAKHFILSEGEHYFEALRPKGITPKEIQEIFEDFKSHSNKCALTFLKATSADLTFMSALEFNRWTDLGFKLLKKSIKGTDLCYEFFESGTIFLKKDLFFHLETWVDLALEINSYSPGAAITFFQSTPVFLERGKPFQLKQRAESAVNILKCGKKRENAASAFLLSSSKMHGFMFSLVFKEWKGTGLLLSQKSPEAATDFFSVDPEVMQELYQTETKRILGIVSSIAKTSADAGVKFYRESPPALLKLNPNIREEVLKTSVSISRKPDKISRSFHIIVQALQPYSNPLQEKILNHAKSIEAFSKKAAFEFFKKITYILNEMPEMFSHFWINEGLQVLRDNRESGIRYFSLASKTSIKGFLKWKEAVLFEDNKEFLSIFAHALSGKLLSLKSREEANANKYQEKGLYPEADGYSIYLPSYISEETTKEENFRLYKITTAHQSGYVEFGTFAPEFSRIWFFLESFPASELAYDIFFIIEDGRIDFNLKNEYRGLAGEIEMAVDRLIQKRTFPHTSDIQAAMEILLRTTLNSIEKKNIPVKFHPHYEHLKKSFNTFYATSNTVWDSFVKACETYQYMSKLKNGQPYISIEPLPMRDKPNPSNQPGKAPITSPPDEITDNEGEEGSTDAIPLTPEALEKLLESLKNVKIKKNREDDVSANGLYLSGLDDFMLDDDLAQLESQYNKKVEKRHLAKSVTTREREKKFKYDEWDYLQGEYRKNWCCLREKEISPSNPDLYYKIYTDYSNLISKVRRQFQQIRPALLETVRGVEQGDELYMPAVIQGVVDKKSGGTPSERIFIRKEKKIRRISTLLLVDMSASTGENASSIIENTDMKDSSNMAQIHPGGNDPFTEKKIIDIEIESLVVMIEALDALDDDYAVYGFSGQGKDKVDFYRIKDFKDPYSDNLKTRISGMEPKQSTRMGTAIRHAAGKLRNIESDHKLLILLSDGFPQDLDYGENRKSKDYALNDTMMALIETGKEGVKTFCITVDQAGNDYLRKMCNPGSYLVIKDIFALPEILPKVVESLMN